MIINQPQDQLELGGGGEAGGRLQVVLPLNLHCGKNPFLLVQGHRWRAESCHGRLEGGGGHRGQPGVTPQHCHHCHFNLWQIPAIARFYATVYGDEEDAMENPTTTVITDYQAGVEPVSHRQVQKNPFQRGSDHLLCRGWALEATTSLLRGHPRLGLVSLMSPCNTLIDEIIRCLHSP